MMLAKKFDQLRAIGRAQFEKQNAALDLLRNVLHGRSDHDELAPVERPFVDIAQAAARFGGLAKWLVKVLQLKNRGGVVTGDEIERLTRGLGPGLGGLAVAVEAFGETPSPDGE